MSLLLRLTCNDMNIKSLSRLPDHFVTLTKKNDSDFEKYKDEVWDLVESSYAAVGGYPGMDKDKLIEDASMWKLVTRGGRVVAMVGYTDKYGGRKSFVSASDGTIEGKKDLFSIWKEDVDMTDRGVFGEVSGKVEKKKLALGAVPIPAEEAQKLLSDKPFLEINEDGFHYTRMIGGEPHEKLMVGYLPV